MKTIEIFQELENKLKTSYVVRPKKTYKYTEEELFNKAIIFNKKVRVFTIQHDKQLVIINRELVKKYTNILKSNNYSANKLKDILDYYFLKNHSIEGYQYKSSTN